MAQTAPINERLELSAVLGTAYLKIQTRLRRLPELQVKREC